MKYLLFLTVVLTGCTTTGQHARDVAATTLKVLSAQQQQIDAKMAAENQFCKQQMLNIGRSLGPGFDLNDTNDIKNTWLFGHLATSAAMDSMVTTEKLISEPDYASTGILMDFLNKGIDDDKQAILQIQQAQNNLQNSFQSNLKALQDDQTVIESMRKNLSQLSESPSLKMQLQQVESYGQAMYDELKKSNTKQPPVTTNK